MTKPLKTWLVCLILTAGCAVPSQELQTLFEESWEFQLRENPLYATSTGMHAYNDLLPSETVSDYQRRLARERAFLAELQSIPREELGRQDQISYDIFERQVSERIAEYEFESYLAPITSRSGFHIAFPELPNRVPLNTVTDYENYIARLNEFERYAEDHIFLMRQGIDSGWVLPGIALKGIENALTPHIVEDAGTSLLFSPFENFPDRIGEQDRQRLTELGETAILNSVVSGYRNFHEFMRDEYLPSARQEIGVSALENGREYYEHRVRMYTTLDISPEDVHEQGLREVERIREEMDQVIDDSGFEGTFEEFVHFLRTDSRFYVEEADELMKEIAYVLKKMDGKLPELFNTLPRVPYGTRPVPDYIAPYTTTAYYSRPSGDGTRAGFYYVNTYDLSSRPLYEVEALSLHEAVPGHHLQIALQQEIEDLPDFRRYAGFTAFVEGWGLYAERLGLEAGFYTDPYSDFGRLTYEMWRALRLVVDTGMHYMGWNRQQAIDYMSANSALTVHNITTEVDRYISWPGQALAYKTGELKIRELRDTAIRELGEDYDIRIFHDVVLLSGAVPLDVLEENVMLYIEENKR